MKDGFSDLSVFVMVLVPLVVVLALFLNLDIELADYGRPWVPFDPEPGARPGIVLRHLNSPQLAYLRQQRRWIAGYVFCSWLSLVVFIIGLGGGREGLNSYWNLGWCAFLAAMFGYNSVQQKVLELRFIRTRPLTLRFLFWSRTGLALTSLLTAIATAVLGLFLMLRMSYGPVWSQGPSVIDAPDIEKQAYLISTLQMSPLKPLLPLLTTTTLVFSLFIAVGSLLWRLIADSTSKFAFFVRWLLWASFVWLFWLNPGTYSIRFKRILFQYNNAGPPRSYAYALILLATAAALLRLAQFLDGRREAS